MKTKGSKPPTISEIVERRRKLVYALRSGSYSQVKSCLRSTEGHCCLGVACEIYLREEGDGEWEDNLSVSGQYKFVVDGIAEAAVLPPQVQRWFGFNYTQGDGPKHPGGFKALSGLNDDGKTFDEIADAIEVSIVELEARNA